MRLEFVWCALAAATLPLAGQKAKGLDFQRDIRPILSDACFQCHGPDKGSRMAGLRLDTKDGALAKVVLPGKPEESPLYKRITHANAAMRMPPAAAHKELSDAQKATLKEWIAQGAPWKEHWAFNAPVKAAVPAGRNAIDYFVQERLAAEGLKPGAEADRRTLARRVAFDLTGLPPEPKDVEAFVADGSANAYERMVDKYLASPRYGEHRARYWLDAARYADTHGIHVDNYREMWPYRDWVINAFNKNMPFDRFTVEQIAGDMLPNRTLEQQIASGFHRCGISTNEAGIIVDEVEAIYAKDRVDTTGTVFLGLTIGCATCHDHKFDPIAQKDFYAMSAFFRNTTQHTMDDNIPDTPPIVVVPQEADRKRWMALQKEREAVMAKKAALLALPMPAKAKPQDTRTPLDAASQVFSLWDAKLDGAVIGEGREPGMKAVRFAKGEYLTLPNQKVFEAGNAFSIATWFYFPKEEGSVVVASQNDPQRKGMGWVIEIGARVANFRLNGDDGKGINVQAAHLEQLEQGSWNHLTVTYDGSRTQAGMRLYLNGRVIGLQGGGSINTRLTGNIQTGMPMLLGKENKRGLDGGAIGEFQIFNRVLTAEEALVVKQWPKADRLRYLTLYDKEYRGLSAKQAALDAEARRIRERGAVTLVMQEKKDSKPTAHILYRGMYDAPREEVTPDVPGVLPPMDKSLPRNRLGLAQWLVDPANPLVARVAINRFWQEVYGTGLVKTVEDFGSQGTPPSHPELLDWLAVEFRESGWDVKRMLKLMVMSDTYRQSATVTPEKLAKDPDNKWLSRGPRFRMDGEVIRDTALAVSGLLDPAIGGASVKPYQPDGVWEAVAMNGSNTKFYKQDSGNKLFRRSLYTFWKRSAPPASMELFNAPTRENCTVRRERTDTPLQALTTMNDTQFVEAARNLAERAMHAAGAFDGRLDYVTERVLARPFSTAERAVLQKAYVDLQAHYERQPGEARKLIAVGESKADAALPAAEFAAWTMLASNVLNLDEALNK